MVILTEGPRQPSSKRPRSTPVQLIETERNIFSFYCFCFFNCNKMCVLSRRRCPYPLCIVHQVSLTTVNSCVQNLLINKVYFPICSQTFSIYYLFVPPPSTHHTSNKVTSIVTFNVTQNSRPSYSRWFNVPLR